jgi:hypothetical protein
MKRKFIWVVISTIIMAGILTLSGCDITYQLSDSEYSDAREEHAVVTYYDNQIYWGWNSGYYYYYGMPHYYPWNYYYNTCPPSHYTHTTHVVITRPVNRPTHRPNTHRPNIRTKTNTKVIVTPNRNTKVKTNTNYTRPNNTKAKTSTRVKANRNNTRTKVNHRKPK